MKKYIVAAILPLISLIAVSQTCLEVKTHSKISDTRGYFSASFTNDDRFGAPASIGDIDGDGIGDIAVGAKRDDDGGSNRGAIYIIFLDKYGRSKNFQKISDTQGGFAGTLNNGDEFGSAISLIGDLNNDGNPEIMVGAQYDDDGGTDRGAIWILSINSSGSVVSYKKISDTQGGFNGILNNLDKFGNYLGTIGDLNNDNVIDIVVGSYDDDDGGQNRGAVYVLFLDTSGSVINEQKISDTAGNFTGILDNDDKFGRPTGIGDLNNDGIEDIAVGAVNDDDGGSNRGAIWILFLDTSGKVLSHQKISNTTGNFNGTLNDNDRMGNTIRSIGDLNGDFIDDLIVSSYLDDDGGNDRGAIWILYMQTNGVVGGHIKISNTEGNFHGNLDNGDQLGARLAFLGDFNNDGLIDIAASTTYDDDGGGDRGAVWILSLDKCISGCSGATQNTFEKVYISNTNERAHSIIKSKDGNYLICGSTTAGAGDLDCFLMKVSPEGDTIWTKTYGSSSNEVTNSIKMRQLSDSSIVFVARTFSFSTVNGGMYLVKTNNDGDILWEKKVDSSSNENARSIELTSDGGFIISGTNGYVMKFNQSGSMEWNKYYSGGGNMHFTSVREITGKKEYVVSGESTGYGQGGRSAYIVYLDSIGNEKWEMILDNRFKDASNVLHVTDEKTILMGGVTWFSTSITSRSAFLAEIDTTGKLIWSRYYSSGNDDFVGFIKNSPKGGFLIAGHSEKNNTYRNMLFETDRFGNLIWSNSYLGKSPSIETSWGEKIEYTDDGGYLMTSYTNFYNPTSKYDIYLLKLDACGNNNCTEQTLSLVQKEREWNISSTNSSVSTWASPQTISSSVEFLSVLDSLLCEYDPSCQLIADFTTDTVCLGDTTQFLDQSYDSLANVTGWQWYFGDGDSNFIDKNPMHKYDSAGMYIARLVIFNDDTTYCSDTIDLSVFVFSVPDPDLGPDTTYCYGQVIPLDPINGAYTYVWSDLSTDSTLNIDSTGIFWAEVSNQACSATDSVQVIFDLPPNLNIGSDTTICQGDSISISINILNATYFWSNGSTNNFNSFSTSAIHWLKVDSGACSTSDSIMLTINSFPIVDLGNDTTICSGDTITFFGTLSQYSHIWSSSDTSVFLNVDTNGIYWLQVSNGPCLSSDTVELFLDIRPSFDLGNDTILCQGDTMRLRTNLTSPHLFQWNTGSIKSNVLVDSIGTFIVQVINGVCTEYDTLQVFYDDSLVVNLGIDTTLCQGTPYLLNAFNSGSTYNWNDSSKLSSLNLNEKGIYWVEVISLNGVCYGRDTVIIDYDSIPLISLGNDTSLCEGDSIVLLSYWPGATYLWNDNSISSSSLVKTSGKRWVQITNGKCQVSDTINLNFVEYPIFNLDSNYSLCNGDTLKVQIDSTLGKYHWSNNDSSFYTTYLDSGIYWVEASNYKCQISDTFSITFLSLPEALNIRRYTICELGYVEVNAGNNGAKYLWSDGSNKMINRIRDTGIVFVQITLNNGCVLVDSVEVSYCEFEVEIPNTITPNGDGKNDTWILEGIERYPNNKVKIFNRNGQSIFETTNYKNNWDGTWEGKELPASVYYYVVDLNNGGEAFKGFITIIRQN